MTASDTLRFGILGPLEVTRSESQLKLGGAKPRALLANLLVHVNKVVSTDKLIDDLWGDSPPATVQTTIQVYVLQLRRLLEPERGKQAPYELLVTSPPGYVLRVAPDSLDLGRFERLAAEGAEALTVGEHERASRRFREALALWRGPAFADLAFESFVQAPAARLEELRLAVLERRVEADLASGRHTELVPELHELCAEYPLREGLAGQHMLALYRSGRQAEALEAYQRTRSRLVDDLGIDPTPALQQLEREILLQDPSLELPTEAAALSAGAPTSQSGQPEPAPSLAPDRAVLLLDSPPGAVGELLPIFEALGASTEPHELILADVLEGPRAAELEQAAARLNQERDALAGRGVVSRTAAFTSADVVGDVVKLASRAEVSLLALVGPPTLRVDGTLGELLNGILENALCDVCFLVPSDESSSACGDGPVLVPFGAGEHDWAALELAAWLARSTGRELRIFGTEADDDAGSRDASLLLADAGLLIQRASGVTPLSRLIKPGREGIADAAADGGLLVAGVSERWHEEGLGSVRWGLARTAPVPVLFARRGLRPGGLAPSRDLTRFGWSVTVSA